MGYVILVFLVSVDSEVKIAAYGLSTMMCYCPQAFEYCLKISSQASERRGTVPLRACNYAVFSLLFNLRLLS